MSDIVKHSDDKAVDIFAGAMKEKLAAAREKGRGGWNDPAQCSVEFLAELLLGHVTKGNSGNFEDIANLAMMLYMRGADPSILSALTADSQALVAAAYEAAASACDARTRSLTHYGPEPHQIDASTIRALIDQPARAALDRVIAEAEKRGAEREREACAIQMDIAARIMSQHGSRTEVQAYQNAAAAIRARGEGGD